MSNVTDVSILKILDIEHTIDELDFVLRNDRNIICNEISVQGS